MFYSEEALCQCYTNNIFVPTKQKYGTLAFFVYCVTPTIDDKILDAIKEKMYEEEHQTKFKRAPPWFLGFFGFQWPCMFFDNEINVFHFSKI